jgi:diamine N-acetyltransferase
MSINQAENKIMLRALEPADLEILYKWENDQDIWRVSNTIVPYSRYNLKKYIESSHLDIYETKQLRLIIDSADKNDKHTSIGAVDLFDFDPYHMRAGIGILIGDNRLRNKGFANKALTEIIRYSFETLQLHQLFANITTDNEASQHLFEKAGFTCSGVKKEWIRIPGGFIDEAFYQLINTTK